MLLILFQKVTQDAKDKLKELNLQESEKEEKLGKQLAEEMATHVIQLGEMIEKDRRELQEEIAEQKKKITTEDMHDGFETHVRGIARPFISWFTRPLVYAAQARACPSSPL
jgi:cell division cycle protein 37